MSVRQPGRGTGPRTVTEDQADRKKIHISRAVTHAPEPSDHCPHQLRLVTTWFITLLSSQTTSAHTETLTLVQVSSEVALTATVQHPVRASKLTMSAG